MPLGLLARDSIQDLEALSREAEGVKDSSPLSRNLVAPPSTEVLQDDNPPILHLTPSMETESLSEQSVRNTETTREDTPYDSNPLKTQTNSSPADLSLSSSPSSPADLSSSSSKDKKGTETKSFSPQDQYNGFSTDYHNLYQTDDNHNNYGLEIQERQPNRFLQSFLPCLFPWATLAINKPVEISKGSGTRSKDTPSDDKEPTKPNKDNHQNSQSLLDNDDLSTGTSGSETLGQKLSSKERQAVLARLGLAQPQAPVDDKNHSRTTVNNVPQEHETIQQQTKSPQPKVTKGILKRGTLQTPKPDPKELEKTGNNNRRMLFPKVSYDASTFDDNHKNSSTPKKHAQFLPMARVVTVKSKNDMSFTEKSQIWWQRADYEDFRKTARVITKAMMEGGTELWLNSARATGTNSRTKNNNESGDVITETGDKWWHKFGHSRRGLEHVVSVEEGRQRQVNVRSAIRAVVEEQKRQKLYNRVDPEKLRMVSLHYTSWARDLASASGSSDADAVSCSFSEARRSREFFLLKISRGQNNGAMASVNRHVPEFMQPALHGAKSVSSKPTAMPIMLDANTSAQIRYRRKSQSFKLQKNNISKALSSNKSLENTADLSKSTPVLPSTNAENAAANANNMLSSADGDREGMSMAQRAAGFSAEGAEKVDMAAVLSGLGAVS